MKTSQGRRCREPRLHCPPPRSKTPYLLVTDPRQCAQVLPTHKLTQVHRPEFLLGLRYIVLIDGFITHVAGRNLHQLIPLDPKFSP